MDENWLTEPLGENLRLGVRSTRLVAAGHSAHQRWEIHDTPALGRLYRLDGLCMAASVDEHLCHEPLVHVAGIAHGMPARALVLGGSDGATARELLKYPSMQQVLVAELDAELVAALARHLPGMADGAFSDPRVALRIGDARDTVVRLGEEAARFDLIVFDLTDPGHGPAAPLFEPPFLQACRALLADGGTLVLHTGSPLFQRDRIEHLLARLRGLFAEVTPFWPVVPLYGGLWGMVCASDVLRPASLGESVIAARIATLQRPLRSLDALRYRALLAAPG